MENISNIFGCNAIVISDNKAITNLEPGNIYLLSTDVNLKEKANAVMTNLEEVRDPNQQLYNYSIVCLKNTDFINEESNLYYPVQNGCNLILPLCIPNSTLYKYLTLHFSVENLEEDIVSVIAQAEKYTKESFEDAFMNLAVQESKTCMQMLDAIQSNNKEEDQEEGAVSSLFNFFEINMLGLVDMACASEVAGEAFSTMSSKSSKDIFNRFINNCKIIKSLSKKRKPSDDELSALTNAKSELDFVFRVIHGNIKNIEILRSLLLLNTDRQNKLYYENYIDRVGIAEKSRIKLLIKDCRKEQSSGTNGKYRIFAQKDGCAPVLIKFTRKPSCIVYLMYLLHMKQNGLNADYLRVSENKELFCKLYTEVYNSYDAEKTFIGLTAHHIDGEPRKARLTNCYEDIRNSLSEVINNKLNETALPFIIPNANSHITVMDKNIEVPEELKNVQFA